MIRSQIWLRAALVLLLVCAASFSLDVTFKIQETTNNAAADYPVTFVAPLPAWAYTDIAPFRVTDAGGTTVPAQISILNKQWQAGYIRHLLITLKTNLAANEQKVFHLKDDGGNTAGAGLTVTETANDVTVVTGPLKFKVKKQNFNLFDEAWLDLNSNGTFDAGEQIILSSPENGGVFTDPNSAIQKSSDVANPRFAVEERGPMRAIIRVEAPTIFTSTTNMTHGWVVRIYAYAGKPFVKVEVTLKNSAFNSLYSYPLYCKDFSVKTRLNLGAATVTVGKDSMGTFSQVLGNSGVYIFQNNYNTFNIMSNAGTTLGSGVKSLGWMDASDAQKGVTVYNRYFWESWPNGLELDTGNVLYARLLPKWDAGYYWSTEWTRASFIKSTTGMHWLDDMQHMTKELMYEFHAGSVNSAKTIVQAFQFQKNPVAVVPVSWWAQTHVTADMGGIIPITTPAASPASTDAEYVTRGAGDFGWPNFMGNIIGAVDRKTACATGDIPFAGHHFLATENPRYYYQGRAYAYGELNCRLEQMGGEVDFANTAEMTFTTMPYSPEPYCNYSWRPGWDFGGKGNFKTMAAYLGGSGPHGWTSRDCEHLWIYNTEDFYYYDGMPIIKDWYKWIGQFGKVVSYDRGDNRVWRIALRGHGHTLSAIMGAYKMTGDSSFLAAGTNYMYKMKAQQSKRNGQMTPESDQNGEGGLHVGYMSRALTRYMEELKNKSCKEYVDAFGALEGLIQWNYNWGHYCYYTAPGVVGTMSGTAMPLIDPELWLYLHTGFTPYKTQSRAFADAKIYGDLIKWNLTSANFPVFVGRLCQYVWENPRLDTVPPPAITDLSGQATQPTGTQLWVKADSLPANQTIYFAVRSFDSTDNMSQLSNIYSVNLGSATSTYLTWTAPATAAYYHVRWSPKTMVENAATMDTSTSYYFWAANAIGNDINAPSVVATEDGTPSAESAALDAYPNPFNPSTHFRISLQSGKTSALLTITDVSGRIIKTFATPLSKGKALVAWNADNARGEKVPSGLYIARLTCGNCSYVKKVMLMK